ncbi:MAG: hypothetical protein WA867_09030 [Candidatus Acidiferrales bacterium]
MKPRPNLSPSANFYRLATVCCAYYVLAQAIQEVAFRYGINDSAAGEAGILQRLLPLDQFRLAVMLFSFFPILVAFAAVALRRMRSRPAASLLGFPFSFVFVTSEVSTRSIELFLLSRKWAVEYHAAASPAAQQLIAGRIQVWADSVGAFYFVLLAGHLLAAACFAIATWDDDHWNRIVALAFIANAVRLAGRMAEGYMGQSWLDPLNSAVYFPAVALIFSALTAWLWKQTPIVQEEKREEILRSA